MTLTDNFKNIQILQRRWKKCGMKENIGGGETFGYLIVVKKKQNYDKKKEKFKHFELY